MPLVTATQLTVAYGELEVFSEISLEIAERARIGVVGPNGQGKTSLLRVLVGEIEPISGSAHRARGLSIGYVPQTSSHMTSGTLLDEVETAVAEVRQIETDLASSALEIERAGSNGRSDAERRYSLVLQQYEAAGGYDYQNRIERVVTGVGLTLDTLTTPAVAASGGERTRTALAAALLSQPDLLVLDEPTNFLDFSGLSWLEGFLGRTSDAFVVVSHDRYFLDQVVDQIWELDHGRIDTYKGNYRKYKELKAARLRRQAIDYTRQREFVAKQQEFIDRYRAGQRSREAKGREKRLNRLERLEATPGEKNIVIGELGATRTGRVVMNARELIAGFTENGKHVELVKVPELTVERGSRTAIIGANGIGKTTLLHTLLGETPPLGGKRSLGHNVHVGFQRQGSYDLPENRSVLDALLDIKNLPPGDARSYLARFLFQGEDVFQPVSSLSGGERTRLALARLMITEPNVLVLDEPTTHLDIASREALEQVLLSYAGTLLFVSHDRHLISLLAHQLWILEDGKVRLFDGPFEEWAETVREPSVTAISRKNKGRSQQRVGSRRRKDTPEKPRPDPEALITQLESTLATLEAELHAASERHDVEKISALGVEHSETQARLERAWEEWAE